MLRHLRRVLVTLGAAALLPGAASAQATGGGTITGRVVDQASQAPLAEAQVVIVGTLRGARTDAQGNYRLAGVPAGSVQLRAMRIGYAAGTTTIAVTEGQTTTADFALAQTAVQLDVVISTATGEQQRKRETGNAVAAINTDSISLAPVTSFSDVLSSRASGVTVQTASGTTGGGSRIRIRGSNSLSLSNDPLLIVDGVRVSNDANSTSIDIGGQTPSAFDELNPEDIENIQVLKGPAASALYGTAAANGVIVVTTKKGRSGATRWEAHAEAGSVRDVMQYPANYAYPTFNAQTGDNNDPYGYCFLLLQQVGQCSPTGGLLSFNPLEQASPFVNGWREAYGISAAGGSDVTTYYLGGDFQREQGVYANNDIRRVNLRANLHAQLLPTLDATINAGYFQGRLNLPQNDNNDLGPLGNGLLGFAVNDETHGFLGLPPEVNNAITTAQNSDRFTGSITSNWQALNWLSFNGVAGIDFTNRVDQQLLPPGVIPEWYDPDRFRGSRQSNPYGLWTYTANLNGTAKHDFTDELTSSTSLGTQYTSEIVHGTLAYGKGVAAGTGSLGGATSEFAAGEQNSKIVTLGAYAQEQLAWRDRVFFTAALRGDDNSAFGADFKLVKYPSASLSWVIGEEPWFPQQDWVSSLRLRASAGQSGQRPGFRNAVTTYTARAVKQGSTDVGAVTIFTVGNTDLKPERSTEFEGGADIGLFANRANLELTYYNKTTRDALLRVPQAPSAGGVTSRYENIGVITNKGFEAQLNATLLDRTTIKWDATLSGSVNNNHVVSLDSSVPYIYTGLGAANGNYSQKTLPGYPAAGYWQPTYTYADANNDGQIQYDEVTLGDSDVYLGNPLPKTEISLNTGVTLFKYARLSALVDHRGGYKLYNATESFRCTIIPVCRAAYDPTAPLGDQARVIASFLGTDAGFIEDASFWKLRELSLKLTAPDAWARRANVGGMSLTLAGRNLHTWTNYTGFDPEVNFAGQANFATADFLTQPPTRYFTARLDVTF